MCMAEGGGRMCAWRRGGGGCVHGGGGVACVHGGGGGDVCVGEWRNLSLSMCIVC